uniref:Uncharacterized protein n=1 Tax=Oryza brachyantha TaxID=4533 RepID=J3MQC5_ORYBR
MGRSISNYMAHLLFANPKMLMAGSGKNNLFKIASKELKDMVQAEKNLHIIDDEKQLTKLVLDKVKPKKDSFIHDAWRLAQGGYLHAKSLGTGVEYLSYVRLLLSHAGMETFPDRLQRRHQVRQHKGVQVRENNATTTSSSDSHGFEPVDHKEGESTAALSASQGEGSIASELKEIVVSP